MYRLSFKKQKNSRIIAKTITKDKQKSHILYLNTYDNEKDKKNNSTSDKRNEINIKNGVLQPLPNKDIIEKIYVSAPSGAGKSHFVANWVKYGEKYIKPAVEDFYIFSSIKYDKPLDDLDPIRIDLDDDLVDDMLELEDVQDSIVLFDDIDTIVDTKLKKEIQKFRDFLLEQGRHENVRLLMTSHFLSNYKETRTMLNESTAVCFFPNIASAYHIIRFLKMHAGFDKKQIEWILNLNTRWICFYRTVPQYLIWETGAILCKNV